jgi:hypothetical protein
VSNQGLNRPNMSRPNKRSAKLIFLHIPKAGGSTLRHLLHKQYPAEQVYKIESDINGDIQRFTQLNEADRTPIQLITGHMSYGLHQCLPGAKYLSFLRDPINRVISEFAFVSGNPHHVLYESVKHMSLSEYLRCGLSSQISNGQTRLIGGVCQDHCVGVPSNRAITEADYQRALYHLEESFILPSTLAFYDETLLLWGKQFGWPLPLYLRENVTPGIRLIPTATERQEILDINHWDTKLYAVVHDKIQNHINAQGPVFRARLKGFKKANWLYGKSVAARRLLKAKYTTRAAV